MATTSRLQIDDALWRQVKAEAATRGVTVSTVVGAALAQYFSQVPPDVLNRYTWEAGAKTETVGKTTEVPSAEPLADAWADAPAFAQFRPVPKPGKK